MLVRLLPPNKKRSPACADHTNFCESPPAPAAGPALAFSRKTVLSLSWYPRQGFLIKNR